MNNSAGTPRRIQQNRGQEGNRRVPESLTTVFGKIQPILARAVEGKIPARLRSKVNPSDVIQETLISLHLSGVTLKDKDEKWRLRLLFQGIEFRISNLIRHFDSAGRLPQGGEQSFESLIESGQFEEPEPRRLANQPCDELCRKEIHCALRAAISKLEPLDQRIVGMRILDFLEFRDIARELDMTENAVNYRFRKCLGGLRAQLPGFDPSRSDYRPPAL